MEHKDNFFALRSRAGRAIVDEFEKVGRRQTAALAKLLAGRAPARAEEERRHQADQDLKDRVSSLEKRDTPAASVQNFQPPAAGYSGAPVGWEEASNRLGFKSPRQLKRFLDTELPTSDPLSLLQDPSARRWSETKRKSWLKEDVIKEIERIRTAAQEVLLEQIEKQKSAMRERGRLLDPEKIEDDALDR